jgi:hypothetical protein
LRSVPILVPHSNNLTRKEISMKFKMIAAALALVVAGSANAALTTGSASTGSSLFIEAWDTVSGVGFVQDLGKTFQSGLVMGQSGSLSFNLDAASFASLLGTDTAGTNLSWRVFASVDLDQPYSGSGILTTVTTVPASGFRADSAPLSVLQGSMNSHIVDINAVLTGNTTFATIPSANVAYGGLVGGSYNGAFTGGNSAKVGFGAIDFYSYTNDPDTFALVETKLNGGIGGDNKFSLSSTGQLTFDASQASAVPLPAAAWLFGSGLLGLVGIARRRKQG